MNLVGQGLTVQKGRATLLHGVDVRFEAGRLYAIVGPNGAGKTTLAHLLDGSSVPTAGTVLFDGTPIRQLSAADLARRRAVLPQRSQLTLDFRVSDVVALGRIPWAETRTVVARHVEDALAAVGLTHLAEARWYRLSGGERQRVHLARVLCQIAGMERAMLFLDEPTNHLDLSHQLAVLRIARQLADEGHLVIAILHDLALSALADEVVVLADGRRVHQGPPREALMPARVRDVFGVDIAWVAGPDGLEVPLPRFPTHLWRSGMKEIA